MEIVIVGAGKLGYKLAETLVSEDNNIHIVDLNDKALQKVVNRLDVLTLNGNGAQLQVLEELDLKKKDLIVAVTSEDETNITICLMAKELGCPKAVARVRSPEYANQIEFLKSRMGIDFITNPELDTAVDIARYVLRGYAAHMESFADGRVGLFDVPMQALPDLAGKRLAEINVFRNILISAISRGGKVLVPSGETVLQPEDILYLIGKRETVTAFTRDLPVLGERRTTRRVMILGGGRAGFYLAQRLAASALDVKIIEWDRSRCDYLAENLRNTLVICGDCTELDLLQDEGLSEMDALVSLTGNDEENLMLALLGKQQGVPKVVAKVSRSNFVPIIERLGIDRAVNPVLISAGEIVRFIQGGQIASLSLLFGGQAEVMELIVSENAPIIGIELYRAKVPQGMIIGAIVRSGEIFIPHGGSVVEKDDRVIVFCLQKELPALQRLFFPKKGGIWRELRFGGKVFRKPFTR